MILFSSLEAWIPAIQFVGLDFYSISAIKQPFNFWGGFFVSVLSRVTPILGKLYIVAIIIVTRPQSSLIIGSLSNYDDNHKDNFKK